MIDDYYDDDCYDDDYGDDGYDDYDTSYVAPKKKQTPKPKPAPKTKPVKSPTPTKTPPKTTPVSSPVPTPPISRSSSPKPPSKQLYGGASPPVPPILKEKDARSHLTVVILGHVDAGKSTITGHLLYHHPSAANNNPHAKVNYAWLLDEDEQERAHGITMDVASKALVTDHFHLVLQDAPGHADYVPAAITGTAVADAALLVVSATDGRKAAHAFGGQLREHALLAKGLGVNQLLVVINKMDLLEWSQEAYKDLTEPLSQFLKSVGFAQVRFVPVTGTTGDNMFKRTSEADWYKGPTLWKALDSFEQPTQQFARLLEKPMRMVITDVTGSQVRGKVLQGWIRTGDNLVLSPVGDDTKLTKLKRLRVNSATGTERDDYAVAGEMLDCTLTADPTRLSTGHILTRTNHRTPIGNRCRAKIWLLSKGNQAMDVVIIKGAQVTFHMHHLDIPCHFSALLRTLKNDGTPAKERPRALTVKHAPAAVVELKLLSAICMESFTDCRALGRFVLRKSGSSIAVGRIEEVLV